MTSEAQLALCRHSLVVHARSCNESQHRLALRSYLVKLCDFGSSLINEADPGSRHVTGVSARGSTAYSCPQVMTTFILQRHKAEANTLWPGENMTAVTQVTNLGYNACAADVWSFGVTLYVLMVGTVPFRAAGPQCATFRAFARAQQPHTLRDTIMAPNSRVWVQDTLSLSATSAWAWPSSFSAGLVDLLQGCLRIRENERLTMDKVKAHPWFRDPTWVPPSVAILNLQEQVSALAESAKALSNAAAAAAGGAGLLAPVGTHTQLCSVPFPSTTHDGPIPLSAPLAATAVMHSLAPATHRVLVPVPLQNTAVPLQSPQQAQQLPNVSIQITATTDPYTFRAPATGSVSSGEGPQPGAPLLAPSLQAAQDPAASVAPSMSTVSASHSLAASASVSAGGGFPHALGGAAQQATGVEWHHPKHSAPPDNKAAPMGYSRSVGPDLGSLVQAPSIVGGGAGDPKQGSGLGKPTPPYRHLQVHAAAAGHAEEDEDGDSLIGRSMHQG